MKNNNTINTFGLIGLGVMGRNLLLNMADHQISVTGFDKDQAKVDALQQEAAHYSSGPGNVNGVQSLKELVANLDTPRAIMLLVPAGKPVDKVIDELTPLLSKQDIIIDGGNSHFTDTDRRRQKLASKNINYLGVGISGGAEGARKGPSIMPGGDASTYATVKPVFEAIAARVNDQACVDFMGNGAAGHYVKMVHNGIEYGLMQVIAEAYDILRNGLNLEDDELANIFENWNNGPLDSFLVEITSSILHQPDDNKPGKLINYILDNAQQKGTGKWTSQSAMDLNIPVPTIDMAVAARDMSAFKKERMQASKMYDIDIIHENVYNKADLVKDIEYALYFSFITLYAQGFHLLQSASHHFNYQIPPDKVAKIWRGGCIIRAQLLEVIFEAFQRDDQLTNLLLDENITQIMSGLHHPLREIIQFAMFNGLPCPGLSSSLSYFDSFTRSRLPTNLIQAQRDYFGAHTYQRIDEEGTFHTNWQE